MNVRGCGEKHKWEKIGRICKEKKMDTAEVCEKKVTKRSRVWSLEIVMERKSK